MPTSIRGTATLAASSGAAAGDQSSAGRRRLGHVQALASAAFRGPRHLLQGTSKFTRKLVKSSLRGVAYAFGEMVGRMAPLRDFYATFTDVSPAIAGLEDGESPFNHLRKETIAEQYLERHFAGFQQAPKCGRLDGLAKVDGRLVTQIVYSSPDVYSLPWAEFASPGASIRYPAKGLAKVKIDMEPLLRVLYSGPFLS